MPSKRLLTIVTTALALQILLCAAVGCIPNADTCIPAEHDLTSLLQVTSVVKPATMLSKAAPTLEEEQQKPMPSWAALAKGTKEHEMYKMEQQKKRKELQAKKEAKKKKGGGFFKKHLHFLIDMANEPSVDYGKQILKCLKDPGHPKCKKKAHSKEKKEKLLEKRKYAPYSSEYKHKEKEKREYAPYSSEYGASPDALESMGNKKTARQSLEEFGAKKLAELHAMSKKYKEAKEKDKASAKTKTNSGEKSNSGLGKGQMDEKKTARQSLEEFGAQKLAELRAMKKKMKQKAKEKEKAKTKATQKIKTSNKRKLQPRKKIVVAEARQPKAAKGPMIGTAGKVQVTRAI